MKDSSSWGQLARERGKSLILLELVFLAPVLTFVVTGEPFFQPSSSTVYADTLAFRGWHTDGLTTWDLGRDLGTAVTTPLLIPALASLAASELVLRAIWFLAHLAAPPLLLRFFERGNGRRISPAFLLAIAPGVWYAFINGDFLSVLALDLFILTWLWSRKASPEHKYRTSVMGVLLLFFGLIHAQLFLASLLYFGALSIETGGDWRKMIPFLLSLAAFPLAIRYVALEVGAATGAPGYLWTVPIILPLLIVAGITMTRKPGWVGRTELATVLYSLVVFSLTLSAFPLLLASLLLIPPLHSTLNKTARPSIIPIALFLVSALSSSAFIIPIGYNPSETAYANPNATTLLSEIQNERILVVNTPPWIAPTLLEWGNEVVGMKVDDISRSVLSQISREVYSLGIGYVVANKDPSATHWFSEDQFHEKLYTYITERYTQLSVLRVRQPTTPVEVYDVPWEDFDAFYLSKFDSEEEIEDVDVWTSEGVTEYRVQVVDEDFLRSSLTSAGPFSFTLGTDSPSFLVEPESSILLRVKVREGTEYLRVNGQIGGQLRNLFEARNLPEEWFHFEVELGAFSGTEISQIEVNIVGRDSGGVDIDYLALVKQDRVRIGMETSPEGISIPAETPFEVTIITRYNCCPTRISIIDERESAPDAATTSEDMFPTYGLPPGKSRLVLRYRDEAFSMYTSMILVFLGIEAALILFRQEVR